MVAQYILVNKWKYERFKDWAWRRELRGYSLGEMSRVSFLLLLLFGDSVQEEEVAVIADTFDRN